MAEPTIDSHETLLAPTSASTPPPAAPEQSPLPALLFDRYLIIRELGRGGMGQVLLARDEELGQPVAIKIVPDLLVKDTEAVGDLKKEVIRGMALTHPNIVRTHNFERDETGAAIIMEYVEGENLNERKAHQAEGCFTPEQILPWIEQLCAALTYAHEEARIVHRDLKPRNLLITQSGKLKIADFGISALMSDTITRNSGKDFTSGTPSYMSPQQALGRRPTPLDDVYSLGATIYDLLTGKPPFFRGHVLTQVEHEIPPSMAERCLEFGLSEPGRIPLTWERAIAACLAKDPAKRPQSAKEVFRLLSEESYGATQGAIAIPIPATLALMEETAPAPGYAVVVAESRAMESAAPPPPIRLVAARPQPSASRGVNWELVAFLALLGFGAWYYQTHRPPAKMAEPSAPTHLESRAPLPPAGQMPPDGQPRRPQAPQAPQPMQPRYPDPRIDPQRAPLMPMQPGQGSPQTIYRVPPPPPNGPDPRSPEAFPRREPPAGPNGFAPQSGNPPPREPFFPPGAPRGPEPQRPQR